jgi:ribonuclease R/exosome complex exonuclease DIS3/RRP44
MDHTGKIYNQWFGRTVIHSNMRLSYEEAQIVIETKHKTIPADISLNTKSYDISEDLLGSIITLDQVAKILRKNRMKQGAISFDKVEVKFDLDDACEPTGVFFKTSQDANKLIEEFMLLANRSVATFIGSQKPIKPFVYRIHDEPDEQKLYDLKKLISNFGYDLDLKSRKSTAASLNKLLDDIKGQKEQNLIDTLTIRTMSKAEYSTQNVGHYGLAFDYYSHFTSPIRRYPDVMVHRLLQHYLDQGAVVYSSSPIQATSFECRAQEGARIELSIDASFIESKSYSGGVINLSGMSDKHAIKVNTGGVVNAQKLQTTDTDVRIRAGGEVNCYVTGLLTTDIKAGGDVHVYGSPKTVSKSNLIGGRDELALVW